MKKVVLLLGFVIILASMSSAADIILNNPQQETYSLGDTIPLSVTIKSNSETSGNFEMILLCNGVEQVFHKSPVYLKSGQEKKIDTVLPLSSNILDDTEGIIGRCKIKANFGEDYSTTNEFRISNSLTIQLRDSKSKVAPEEKVKIEGNVIRENGKSANGFVDLIIIGGEMESESQELPENITGNLSEEIIEEFEKNQKPVNAVNESYQGTINNGFFSFSFSLPKYTPAGKYLLRAKAYEKDITGQITNTGETSYNIEVEQVPTSLEVNFETRDVEPGSNIKVRSILHDQSGEKIETNSVITITDNEDQIRKQTETKTGEYIEVPVKKAEAPAEWTATSSAGGLTQTTEFNIIAKESVNVEIVNESLVLTNEGNVPYNKTVLVKIGTESVNVNTSLDIGESRSYRLTAPDGEYKVKVVAGDNEAQEIVTLTGNAVGVKENSAIDKLFNPFVWTFLLLLLGFLAVVIMRRSSKRDFFGYFKKRSSNQPQRKKENTESSEVKEQKRIIDTKNRAEMSLSLKGEKQDSTMVCLKIKNDDSKISESVQETLQNASSIAEKEKAKVYESGNHIFFIFSPLFTKTFKNGKTAVKTAREIKKIIEEHNKTAKHKIEFGMSVHNGDLVGKKEGDVLRFMSLGDLMAVTKRISSAAENDIYLSEKTRGNLMSSVKTERKEVKGMEVYAIKDVKEEKPENQKFISDFLKRIEKS